MSARPSAAEILAGTVADVERIHALGGGAGAELARDLREAQRRLARQLRREAAKFGGRSARFTGASATAYREQIAVMVEYLTGRIAGLTEAQASAAVAASMARTVRTMEALELRFTGIQRPLRLREAARMSRAVAGARSSLLAQIPTSVDRYGQAMIAEFEGMMRVGLVQGSSMDDMIAMLTGHGGPSGRVSLAARMTSSGVVRLVEADIPEGLFVRHRYWAERVVRTETIRAYNGARMEALREIRGDDFPDLQKKIVAILDSRTAPDSIAVNGQIRDLDAMFEDGEGRQYLYPPARPNDRETTIPWRPGWTDSAARGSRRERAALGETSVAAQTRAVNRMREDRGLPPIAAPE